MTASVMLSDASVMMNKLTMDNGVDLIKANNPTAKRTKQTKNKTAKFSVRYYSKTFVCASLYSSEHVERNRRSESAAACRGGDHTAAIVHRSTVCSVIMCRGE